MKNKLQHFGGALVALCFAVISVAADIRLKVHYTANNRTFEKIIYIKGSRQRDEPRGELLKGKMNGDSFMSAFIHQCDAKRFVWLDLINRQYATTELTFRSNDEARIYYEEQAATPGSEYATKLQRLHMPQKKLPAEVTAMTTLTDTGERREMFGYTARHIKTLTTWEATSKAACDLSKARYETDGWYVDLLYGLDCSSNLSGETDIFSYQIRLGALPSGKCGTRIAKDQYRLKYKTIGSVRIGFPIFLTMTLDDGKNHRSVVTNEVVELSTEELAESLFEIPAGYTETQFKRIK